MNKINNKGFTIVEIILSFSFIMIISTGLFMSATNYKNKQQKESAKKDLDTYKMDLISDIHKDIDEKGLKNIEVVSGVNNTYKLTFYDNSVKTVGIYTKDGKEQGITYGNKNYVLKSIPTSINISLLATNEKLRKITIEIDDQLYGNYYIKMVLPTFN